VCSSDLIVGRQVSYMNKARRLSWALLTGPAVVGNSCNYLSVTNVPFEQVDRDEYLLALLAVLNSAALDWYFRVYNSNNHVANYEIDEFPMCLSESSIPPLACAARFLATHYANPDTDSRVASSSEDVLDALVAHFFGLSTEQALAILEQSEPARATRVAGMVSWLAKHGVPEALASGTGWYQHIEASLSAHDREVIDYIPQGGNWTSIPESVPSKRLEQIRAMTKERGGLVRTSYYGRLRPDQPSYTIATYYNRPGNGTNIPPWEDRVLTSREAARLQSFPDWYIFASKETAVRKQIGNAVPPLLAYSLGQELLRQSGPLCVDLFAGAGGLSLGLELAGAEVVGACDNDARASATYTLNRPCEDVPDPTSERTLFLEADLSSEHTRVEVANAFLRKLAGRPLNLLVGGPPCQGFSHAGWRESADARNDLAAAFLEFASLLDPQIVVLENVEGLLSYRKGQTVQDLLDVMRELGYETGESPWLLNAECYGVPQMRRRVFLVGAKPHVSVAPPPALFQKCKGRRETTDTLQLFLESEPYPTTVYDALYDLPRLGPVEHPDVGPRPYRPHFGRWARGEISTEELLSGLHDIQAAGS